MTSKWNPKARKSARKRARKPVWNAADEAGAPHPSAAGLPVEISAALDPGEAIEAGFKMSSGLEIYATSQRLLGAREGRVRDIRYTEVTDARRKSSNWRTSRGIARIGLGIAFIAAGLLTGFATPLETMVGLGLLLVGGGFVFLGFYRRDDWVELKIDRKEPPPSFWYIVVFLPFWLILQSRKRYRVAGDREEVDAFYEFLTARLASRQAGEEDNAERAA